MAGSVKKRTYKAASGNARTVWRARYPDPHGTKPTDQIERSFATKLEAENWLKRQSVAVLDGNHVDPRKSERLLVEVADGWRETWGDLADNTKLGYHYTLNKHIIGTADRPARFYRTKVGAMSAESIQRWVNDLAKDHTPAAVRRIFTVMRSVLRVAVERRYITYNPCDAVRLPKTTGKQGGRRMVFLTPVEVRMLADAMPAEFRLPVRVAAWTGLRAGELWALRRRDVDPLHGLIRVERALKEINTSAADLEAGLVIGPPKTEESVRRVDVNAALMDLLRLHVAESSRATPDGVLVVRDDGTGFAWGLSSDAFDPDALLFTMPTGYAVRHNQFYKRVFRPALIGTEAVAAKAARRGRAASPARAAIPAALPERLHGLRFHDLRHTAASLSLAVTPNLHAVKERLGHKDIHMTVNTYGHLTPSLGRAIAAGLDDMFNAPDGEGGVIVTSALV